MSASRQQMANLPLRLAEAMIVLWVVFLRKHSGPTPKAP